MAVRRAMSLRQLLTYAHEDASFDALAEAARSEPQRAFVSASLRPYLLASLLDADPARPGAGRRRRRPLRARPRRRPEGLPGRRARCGFYPARGVRYESHLAPPPHLVGPAHRGARRARSGLERRGGRGVGAALAREGARSRSCARTASRSRRASCSTSRRSPSGWSRAATSASTRSRTAASSRSAATSSTSIPATEERAVRCELFDIEVERLTYFSTFTQRSLEEAERVEIAPAAELGPEHRELAEMAATESEEDRPGHRRAAAARPLRRDARARPRRRVRRRRRRGGARRRRSPTTGRTSPRASTTPTRTTSTSARSSSRRRSTAARPCASRASPATSRTTFRAQSADTAARSLKEAEPELEKLVRSGYRTVVTWARRGEAERAAYNLARLRRRVPRRPRPAAASPGVWFAAASAARGLPRAGAEARHRARAPAAAPPPRDRAQAGPRAGGGAAIASFTDLRAGDAVVHEDHGIARFTGFETKTVGGVTRDYLELEYKDGDRVFVPSDQLHKISRYVGRGRGRPAAVEARRQGVGADEAARAARRAGARGRADQPLRRAQAPRRPRRSRPTASGSSTSSTRSRTARRPTSSRRSST